MKFIFYSDWSQLPQSADALFEGAAKQSLFFTREWFETLSATMVEDGQSLLLFGVIDDGRLLALLPLIGSGDRWQSYSHRYSSLFSLLMVEGIPTEALVCLAEGLSQFASHSLQLSPVAEDDSNLLMLGQVLESLGYECHQHFLFYNWIHRTGHQSFDEYMAARPAQLRNTITRKQRKLEREHKFKLQLFKGDEVQQGLKDYYAAYSASWKANEQYVDLLDALAINLAVPGWTRLAILTIEGKAAAAQLWFVVQGKASIFRLAYDEQWKHYSPGSILTAYLMRYVIDEDKVEEIDFLTGNEAYKQDWMSGRRQRLKLLFVKPPKPQSAFRRLMTKFIQRFNNDVGAISPWLP